MYNRNNLLAPIRMLSLYITIKAVGLVKLVDRTHEKVNLSRA